MEILITGGAGFVGSHLVDKLLEQDYKVIGIDCFTDYYQREIKEANINLSLNLLIKVLSKTLRRKKALAKKYHKNAEFEFIEEDIFEMDKLPEVDCVFHEAAQAGVRASWGKSFEIYTRNNIEAAQRLLAFYKDREIKKFVYASSSSVYGDAELPMKDDSLLKPVSPYGVTKLAGENLCYLYWTNYGVPTVCFIAIIEKLVENKARVEYIEKQKGDVRDTWADVNRTKRELG
jgi:nucleoside-diphosphate-sugar epimerase